MPISGTSGPAFTFRSVMVFIDGGYLRSIIQPSSVTEVDFTQLAAWLNHKVAGALIKGELIRAFYYDANVSAQDDPNRHRELNSDFEIIKRYDYIQLRLGRLIRGREGWRQKGVDVLLAIDMITKAYKQQYEIAVMLAGDDDFVDVDSSLSADFIRTF